MSAAGQRREYTPAVTGAKTFTSMSIVLGTASVHHGECERAGRRGARRRVERREDGDDLRRETRHAAPNIGKLGRPE